MLIYANTTIPQNFEHYRTINTVIILGVTVMATPYKTKQPVYLKDPSGRFANILNPEYADTRLGHSLQLQTPMVLNFPFTPTISVIQSANYSSYDLTHTNFQQRAFESATNMDLNITAPMIVRNAEEALYVYNAALFLRAAMKMTFGQDDNPGSPPPVLRFYAHGIYENVPCMIRDFTWNLDSDIDYVEIPDPKNSKKTIRIPVMNMFVLSLSTTYSPKSVRENFSVKQYLAGNLKDKGYV
jgi:hypothetical protein